MKKVISACIDRAFEFDSKEEAAVYLSKLEGRKAVFVIVEQKAMKGGKYRLRTKEQYNNNPLMK